MIFLVFAVVSVQSEAEFDWIDLRLTVESLPVDIAVESEDCYHKIPRSDSVVLNNPAAVTGICMDQPEVLADPDMDTLAPDTWAEAVEQDENIQAPPEPGEPDNCFGYLSVEEVLVYPAS